MTTRAAEILAGRAASTRGVRCACWLCDGVLLVVGEELSGRAVRVNDDVAVASVKTARWEEETLELTTVVRKELAGLSAEARRRVIEFLVAETSARSAELEKSLFRIREGLRERFEICEALKGCARALRVEGVHRIDDSTFYVHGWGYDIEGKISGLTAVSPIGEWVEILPAAQWFSHADVDGFYSQTSAPRRSGFAAVVKAKCSIGDGWLVEMRGAGGVIEGRAPAVVSDLHVTRKAVLGHVRAAGESFIEAIGFDVTAKLQERLRAAAEIAEVIQFGAKVEASEVSIVVPVFGRVDLVEHQLAQFARDAEIGAAELIYVLDSPELAEELKQRAAGWFDLYRARFALAVVKQNVGFANAANLGVEMARGKRVVVMHSDAQPEKAGWISAMRRAMELNRAGIVGARLLYHDDSVQHAGFEIRANQCVERWKGMHRELERVSQSGEVAAVSGACLMIDHEVWKRAGGFSAEFVDGDYEDVDLCLRAKTKCWYAADAIFYHLEGQSRSAALRGLARPYNDWVFSHRRGAAM